MKITNLRWNPETAGQPKILIMDDEPMISSLLSSMLSSFGFNVTSCANGEDTIAHYKSAQLSGAPFLAVIMDLHIPVGMGGKDAAKQILDFDPSALLIVSSGSLGDPVMADPTKYGFRGLLPKPYKASRLFEVLSEIFTNSQPETLGT